MIELGVFARVYPFATVTEVVSAAAADGFSLLHASPELVGLDPSTDGDVRRLARDALDAAGVAVFSVSGTFNAIHPDLELRRRETRRLARTIPGVPSLGCDVVTLNTGTRDPHDKWRAHADNTSSGAWTDLLRTLEVLVPVAEAHGVRLGIEPEGGNVIRDAHDVLRLLAEVGSDSLGVILDPANLLSASTLADQHHHLQETIDQIGSRVIGAHAKDLTEHGPAHPGSGAIDWPWLLPRLIDASPDRQLKLILQDVAIDDLSTVRAYLERCAP